MRYKKGYEKFLRLFGGGVFKLLLRLVLFMGVGYYEGRGRNGIDEVMKD
ncbi:hypothetical protein [Staphylococcus saprophyticus]|nr:hypothetical protein [Staphylococcus saprophyticus]